MLHIVDVESNIPLLGLDFLGVIDRGTNLVEVKPTTLCNLQCRYCYANSGYYEHDFHVEPRYMLETIKDMVSFKGLDAAELHLDPYGEAMLYPWITELVAGMSAISGVRRVSMQTNGTLLSRDKLVELHHAGLNQVNITLNSLDENLAKDLAGVKKYDRQLVVTAIETALGLGIDVVITPVWFFNVNDPEIAKIIVYFKELQEEWGEGRVAIGIQNYLEYKTGRKLKKTRERQFHYFYSRLRDLEKAHNVKLRIGPKDFGIESAKPVVPRDENGNAIASTKEPFHSIDLIHEGRQAREYIGKIGPWGVKVIDFKNKIQDIGRAIKPFEIKVKGSLVTALL